MSIRFRKEDVITPAIKYLNIVIPAKAGIQEGPGCRIKSGMTELDYLVASLIFGTKAQTSPGRLQNLIQWIQWINAVIDIFTIRYFL